MNDELNVTLITEDNLNINLNNEDNLNVSLGNDTVVIGDKNYFHNQTTASNEWVITHNLNKYPSVTILNSAGEEVIGDVTYNSVNQVTITFVGAFKGTATLN